ncbi:MAG: methyltransferase domain-containing protein [Alphaproteobacteria bacterium]|nr:methyltransferase domain-containing protein [Alphaproteobacteria bacterium]
MTSDIENLLFLALAEHRAGRKSHAEALYRDILKAEPRNASAHNLLGAILMERGENIPALSHLRKAAMNAPDFEAAQTNFGSLLYTLAKRGEDRLAREEARSWAKRQPKNSIAQHWAAALGAGSKVQGAMPEALVRKAFDGFAGKFDEKLAKLGYQVPKLIASALSSHVRPPLDILDAGCGTGLMAMHLKPWARSLEGVDLSPAMIEQARARGLYDALETAELVAYLQARLQAFDLIAAADVFCYLGDLAPVLAASKTSLRASGLLAFTVEAAEGGDVMLGQSGRYAHSETYVRSSLGAAGFTLLSLQQDIARHEDGQPVGCFVVVAEGGA